MEFLTNALKNQSIKNGETWNGDINYSELGNEHTEKSIIKLFLTKLLELDQKMVQNNDDTVEIMEQRFVTIIKLYNEMDVDNKIISTKYFFRYLFYLRNIRGQGKRSRILFYNFLKLLNRYFPHETKLVINLVPEYGYFGDLNNLIDMNISNDITNECIDVIIKSLKSDMNMVLIKNDQQINELNNSQLYEFFKTYNDQLKSQEELNENIQISLVAKWIKREDKSNSNYRINIINELFFKDVDMNRLKEINYNLYNRKIKYGQKLLRIILSSLCQLINLVEHNMTNATTRGWDKINFDIVPSKAITKYRKAFLNLDKENEPRYFDEDRIKCSENIMKSILDNKLKGAQQDLNKLCNLIWKQNNVGENEKLLINQQWRDMVNSVSELIEEESKESEINLRDIIPVIDVSGSMSGANVMHQAIGLGVLCAMISNIPGMFITFSSKPSVITFNVDDNIFDIFKQVEKSNWGYSTNIDATYQLLLKLMIKNNVPKDTFYSLLILTDGQFNSMVSFDENRIKGNVTNAFNTFYDRMEIEFKNNGYMTPRTIFWNLNERSPGFPASSNLKGVQLVSGFSQTLMKQVLSGEFKLVDGKVDIDPLQSFINVLDDERFDLIDLLIL